MVGLPTGLRCRFHNPRPGGKPMKRYLVLVHLAAAFPKAELTTRAATMHAALKSTLDTMETVLTADRGFAFACLSAKPAAEL